MIKGKVVSQDANFHSYDMLPYHTIVAIIFKTVPLLFWNLIIGQTTGTLVLDL